MPDARLIGSAGILLALVLGGCSAPAQSPAPAPQVEEIEEIEGAFDVGGYSLYLHCQGSGSPTVVYFHGSAFEPGASSSSASAIPGLIRDRYRFCAYDRVNVGQSDDRPDLTTGTEAIRALHALLEAADVTPPFVLLGASFGGLLAYEYLMTYPAEVEGMVLLDAAFPDELTLEPLFPPEDQLENEDWASSSEKINQFLVYTETMALRGEEPDIPVVYLRATPQTWTWGIPEYDAVILGVQEDYVHSFPRGELKEVPSPHYMEAAVAPRIVEELQLVIDQIR